MIVRASDEEPLFTAIKRQIFQQGINKLIIITGGTQKGKSRLMLKFGLSIDKNFSIAKRIAVIDPYWFMDIVNQNMPRGSVPCFDDAGLGINSQDWSEFQVKTLSRIFHIIGNQGYCIIITTPHLKFIASQVRAVCTDRVMVTRLDKARGKILFKYYADIKFDEQSGKEYKSFPTIIHENGKRRQIKKFVTKQPAQEILTEFYSLESKRKTQYRKESHATMIKNKALQIEADKSSAQKILEIYEKIITDPTPYIDKYSGRRYIDQSKIEIDFNIGNKLARRVKRMVEDMLQLNKKAEA